ncbi:DUF58 domain-containing protein [Candidatus Woesearchaeota archaeon]|nr:DUF58 domain-containing protein [Candidatus Woesearchaeota archaeon]
MITTEYLSGLDKFNLIMRKRVTSKYAGSRPSVMTGKGATIKDFRIYSTGDDFRLIDWKVFARTDNLYVKRHEEERNLVLHVIIDSSASMNFGKPTKFEYASMLGIGFAYIAMKGNEKFQYATFSNTMDIFQPKRGMGHLANMVDHLNKVKPSGTSDFAEAIGSYKKFVGSKSIMIIISDFLFDPENIKQGLFQLGNNDIKLIQVLDPSEKKLNVEGDVKLKDLETNIQLKTYVSSKLKSEYQRKLEQHISQIEEAGTSTKTSFHSVTTDTLIFEAFYQILK